jgi:hypothetical protein
MKAEKHLSVDQPNLKKWFIENVIQIDVTLNIINRYQGYREYLF